MATRTETIVVYAAGVVQGIALVTFPAASTIFTDPDEYDLSSTQYGTLFLPQVIAAIAAALMGASLGSRFGTKRVYLAGLAAGLVSMAVLIVSQFVTDDKTLAYVLLLVATAFLGAGFGLHFLSTEVDAPSLGLHHANDSMIKGGLSALAGITLPLSKRLDNFMELKYHHLPGYSQLKINMGIAWRL